jgi:Fe-S-cluster containining protein
VRLADMGDKYADDQIVEIDCASRIHLCHARCCTFKFFLTKQDLDEGIARWDYGNPYWIRQADDGYCMHSDPQTRACTVWAQRPHTCRKYDCRNDKRVWLDFDKMIPAPMPDVSSNAPVAMAEVALQNSMQAKEE